MMNQQQEDTLRRAEYAVCGAAMMDGLDEVRKAKIKPKTFYFPAARRVFAVIEELDAERKATDPAHVAIMLQDEILDGEQGDEVVSQMNEAYTTPTKLPEYISEVVSAYWRREQVREARGLIQALEDGNAGEIAAARARLAECSKAGTARRGLVLIPDEDLIARNTPPPVELVEGLLAVGELVLLTATAKTGKSWYLLQMAKAIASGVPFLGRATRQGEVVYVNSENGEVAWEGRTRNAGEAMGIQPTRRQLFHACTRGQGVTLANLVEDLKEGMEKEGLAKVAAIIIDPFYSLAGGLDENAAGEVAAVMLGLQRLAEESGAAVIVAHHTGKGEQGKKTIFDRARGSSAFGGSVDTFISLTESGGEGVREDVVRRNARSPAPRMLQLTPPLWSDLGEAPPEKPGTAGAPTLYTLETVLKLFTEEDEVITVKEIVEETGMSKTTAYELVKRATKAGQLVKEGGGYKKPNQGNEEDR